jgi:hypothetical protein
MPAGHGAQLADSKGVLVRWAGRVWRRTRGARAARTRGVHPWRAGAGGLADLGVVVVLGVIMKRLPEAATRWIVRGVALCVALVVAWGLPAWWCGRDADAWLAGEADRQRALAEELIAFEERDDALRGSPAQARDRFVGEWALVTHQMIALGLAQVCLAHPELPGLKARLVPYVTRAARKSFSPEMRDFGTRAWQGEDALASLDGEHGHAYLAYPALAVGMARLLDPRFPEPVARQHDALIAAFERRLSASQTGLIETYPGEAYPTDVAAVAAAIAVHGRATGADHRAVLAHWARCVRERQVHAGSGLVFQRMGAGDGRPHDAPRGSGTGLAAYFAGFADRQVSALLAEGLFRHEAGLWGFGAIREYADGYAGRGDVDSGPVLLGVSVAATGFALAPARALGRRGVFLRLYRTAELFGLGVEGAGRFRFATGGPIGNALLLAFLTSGPERAP